MKLPGFYVEGRHFGTRFAQASARACFLAREYSRAIDVNFRDHKGVEKRKITVQPYQARKALRMAETTLDAEPA